MNMIRFTTATLLTLLAAHAAFAQTAPAPNAATDISKADLEALAALSPGDHQGKVVDIGKLNVGVAVVHRTANRNEKPGDPIRGIAHDQTTEVYYILSGSGMLTTGGTMVDPKRERPDSDIVKVLNGPSTSGTNRGGYTRRVGPGDVIVIPPGVFHGWSQITDQVTYLTVRPDPDRVLPAGYVNPVLARPGS
jgi:mannose-6-phosphate isomerase-like protein (cupin superfamily)